MSTGGLVENRPARSARRARRAAAGRARGGFSTMPTHRQARRSPAPVSARGGSRHRADRARHGTGDVDLRRDRGARRGAARIAAGPPAIIRADPLVKAAYSRWDQRLAAGRAASRSARPLPRCQQAQRRLWLSFPVLDGIGLKRGARGETVAGARPPTAPAKSNLDEVPERAASSRLRQHRALPARALARLPRASRRAPPG